MMRKRKETTYYKKGFKAHVRIPVYKDDGGSCAPVFERLPDGRDRVAIVNNIAVPVVAHTTLQFHAGFHGQINGTVINYSLYVVTENTPKGIVKALEDRLKKNGGPGDILTEEEYFEEIQAADGGIRKLHAVKEVLTEELEGTKMENITLRQKIAALEATATQSVQGKK